MSLSESVAQSDLSKVSKVSKVSLTFSSYERQKKKREKDVARIETDLQKKPAEMQNSQLLISSDPSPQIRPQNIPRLNMLNTKRSDSEIHHNYNEEEYAKKKKKHQRKRKPLKPSKEAVSLPSNKFVREKGNQKTKTMIRWIVIKLSLSSHFHYLTTMINLNIFVFFCSWRMTFQIKKRRREILETSCSVKNGPKP